MRAAELERGEIELEPLREPAAVPRVGAEELLIVLALLVPVSEQRAGEVEAFSVPALRDHVHLATDLLLGDQPRVERIAQIIDAADAVSDSVHEPRRVIRTQAHVDRNGHAGRIADRT